MEILLKEHDTKGFAIAQEHEKRAGIMSYSIAGPNLIIIDHTVVEPGYQGRDVGKQMLYKVVEMAREKKIKIIPLCPFAAAMFKKTEDIKDVL
ncbi:MAG: N-acetyltransferase [Niastella sp.]|nr:N-acetyltransferase [Niastella sp.]